MAPPFGVDPERTGDPVNPPPVDRQRLYMANGPPAAMNALGRPKLTTKAGVNTTRPGGFRVRERTLKNR